MHGGSCLCVCAAWWHLREEEGERPREIHQVRQLLVQLVCQSSVISVILSLSLIQSIRLSFSKPFSHSVIPSFSQLFIQSVVHSVSCSIDTIDYITGIGHYSRDAHYNVYKRVKRPC